MSSKVYNKSISKIFFIIIFPTILLFSLLFIFVFPENVMEISPRLALVTVVLALFIISFGFSYNITITDKYIRISTDEERKILFSDINFVTGEGDHMVIYIKNKIRPFKVNLFFYKDSDKEEIINIVKRNTMKTDTGHNG